MDHGHEGMDHGGHMDHDMPMPSDGNMCSMNMLWNHDIKDVCVVFPSWHIQGPVTMALSCLVVVAISILYAYLLSSSRNLDRTIAQSWLSTTEPGSRRASQHPDRRASSLIPPIPASYGVVENGQSGARYGLLKLPIQARLIRAGIYALLVALSYWLMLVAMTYNSFLCFSIVLGAFAGHMLYESEMDANALAGNSKGLACH